MRQDDGIVIHVTRELHAQVVKRASIGTKHCYAHNNGEHMIVWVFDQPIEQLIGKHIAAETSMCYGTEKLALPMYQGKQHLKVRMSGVAENTKGAKETPEILAIAPRYLAVGRKPTMKNRTIVKAAVPGDMAELFKVVGEGEVSKGIRIAGELLAQALNEKPQG